MGLAHWFRPIVMQFAWYRKALIIVKFVTSALRIIGTDSNELKHSNSHSVIDSVHMHTCMVLDYEAMVTDYTGR